MNSASNKANDRPPTASTTSTNELPVCRQDSELCNLCGYEKLVDEPNHDDKNLSKFLGYTPLLSQMVSLICVFQGKRDLAKDFQRLFVQGFVNFFKRIFYVMHVLICCKLRIKLETKTFHQSSLKRDRQDSWMATVQQERLCDLCLPGTHNSHAYDSCPTAFGTDWVLCQRFRVREQLETGVRLLDLRISSDEYFGHGPVRTTCLDMVANDLVTFLCLHPTEIVVCLVKANGSHFKSNDAEQTPARLFHQALEKAWLIKQQISSDRCQCGTNSLSIVMPESEPVSTRLKQKSVAELTENGTVGAVVVDTWSNWEGSWNFTRSNTGQEVGRKSREWALSRSNMRRNIMGKPRVLELVVTVDAGTTGKTIQLALIHSVESLNHGIHQENLLSACVLSQIHGILLDYPNESQMHSIISYNQNLP